MAQRWKTSVVGIFELLMPQQWGKLRKVAHVATNPSWLSSDLQMFFGRLEDALKGYAPKQVAALIYRGLSILEPCAADNQKVTCFFINRLLHLHLLPLNDEQHIQLLRSPTFEKDFYTAFKL